MFKEKDRQTRAMYVNVPFPFVSFEDFFLFREGFLATLRGIINLDELNGKRILDAGCGTGEKACILAELAGEVVAADFSPASIARARENKERLGLKNIEFVESSLLSFDNVKEMEKFDIVFCSGVLHHLSDPYAGWRNIISCLKPGGLVIVGLYHRFGYFNHWWKNKLINQLAGEDEERKFKLAAKLFYFREDAKNQSGRAKFFDSFVHPQVAIISMSHVYKNWFRPHNVSVTGVSAKDSGSKFVLSELSGVGLRLALIDLWFSLRQKGFVFISGIKKK